MGFVQFYQNFNRREKETERYALPPSPPTTRKGNEHSKAKQSKAKLVGWFCCLRHLIPIYRLQYWGDEAARNPPTVSYEQVMAGDHGVGELTTKLVR